MRIAVISDIHDNVWNLETALTFLKDCDAMICCGDLCSPFIIDQLGQGFRGPIDIVWGNNDADQFRMTAKAPQYPQIHLRGEFFEGEFDGVRIAVNHFDSIGLALARGRQYDAVFFGHNHRYEIAWIGEGLAINPGSILGVQFGPGGAQTKVAPSMVIYDTETKLPSGFEIVDGVVRGR